MYSTSVSFQAVVARERSLANVASERLLPRMCLNVSLHDSRMHRLVAAHAAAKRPLSDVRLHVQVQLVLDHKLDAAVRARKGRLDSADLPGVNRKVPLQGRLALEHALAHAAHERVLAVLQLVVAGQGGLLRKLVAAHIALVGLFARVSLAVDLQRFFGGAEKSAHRALDFLVGVRALVAHHVALDLEFRSAEHAGKRTDARVGPEVDVEFALERELFIAFGAREAFFSGVRTHVHDQVAF